MIFIDLENTLDEIYIIIIILIDLLVNITSMQNPLTRRYATKKFDSNQKIPDEILDQITEAFRFAPSSLGVE